MNRVRAFAYLNGLIVVAGTPILSTAAETERPNVLFIAVDDLNDWIGCLGGHPDVKTPNIDRLAARGMLFTNAHCVSPACNPSRTAIFTGLRPSTTGVYANGNDWRRAVPDLVTLPQHFRKNGYRVAGGGKLQHYPEEPEAWDDFFPVPRAPGPRNTSLSGIDRNLLDWGAIDVADEEMQDYKTVSWASDQLRRKHDRPFFLAVGIVKPHLYWYLPKSYFEMYPLDEVTLPDVNPDDLKDVPSAGIRMAQPDGDHAAVTKAGLWREGVQAYLASISFADGQIGRLLDALDESGQADKTIVILWGDHGWHLGEKLHWRKFTLWEEATRAPLIIAAPGLTEPGSRCTRSFDFLHLYPTLADLCSLPVPEHVEGVSLRPLLQSADAEWDHPALTNRSRGNHAVRTDRWRYIRYADGSEELYDHRTDPLEWKNLAKDSKYTQIKNRLARRLPKHDAPEQPNGRSTDVAVE